MLRIILLSIFLGICSTCLIRPWFWKNIITKQYFNDYGKRIGFTENQWKKEIMVEILIFSTTTFISLISFIFFEARQNIYGIYLILALAVFNQIVWAYQGKFIYKAIPILVALFIVLFLQDTIVSSAFEPPLKQSDKIAITTSEISTDSNSEFVVSNNVIRTLFNANNTIGPMYNNGKYIFYITGSPYGNGILLINKNDSSDIRFIECDYKFNIFNLRSTYPSTYIDKMYIAISDDNIPYGVYAMADKTWILGSYKLTGYITLNLFTGEIAEYTEENLPEFIKDIEVTTLNIEK